MNIYYNTLYEMLRVFSLFKLKNVRTPLLDFSVVTD